MEIANEPIMQITFPGCPPVIYANPNEVTKWRIETLFTKEPETINWISGFQKEEILIDIGANVGMYTIWAAMASGATVYAFEPEAQNFMTLNKNIFYNNLSDRVTAYPLAIGELNWEFSTIGLSDYLLGGSGHQFGEKTKFNQGCLSVSLDTLMTKMQIEPNYIKIDVDGLEPDVINGAMKTLETIKMKSALVELNTLDKKHMVIFDIMRDLYYKWDQNQINKDIVKDGPFTGYVNAIFTHGS